MKIPGIFLAVDEQGLVKGKGSEPLWRCKLRYVTLRVRRFLKRLLAEIRCDGGTRGVEQPWTTITYLFSVFSL